MKRLAIVLTLLVFCILELCAQIPRTLSYQGILSDTAGVPKPNGNYAMTFRLYNVAQNGAPLWTETQTLGTKRGLFSAVLGDITPFPDSLRFDRRYWLGIQVSPDPELTPRIQLTATGYSIRSRTADTAQYARAAPGSSIADSARIAGTIPNNSITSGKIASGQVVKSVNNLHDAVILRAQGGATITTNGDTITINSGAGGGGTGIQGIQNTDNTLVITNPTGPTATVNARVPFSLNGNWTGEQGALQVIGDKPTIRLSGGAISGNESWIMHLGSDGPGNLSFFRRSGAATWTNVMSLATNGNVGISAVSGAERLTVGGASPADTKIEINAGGDQYAGLRIENNQRRWTWQVVPSNDTPGGRLRLTEEVGNAERLSITGDGNVGIGTSVPFAGLEVHNSLVTRDAIKAVTNAPGGWGVAGIAAASSEAAVYAYNPGASALVCNGGFYQQSGVFRAFPSSTIWTTNKPATVKLNDGTLTKLFSEEAAEIYFSDYGEGQLVNGRTHIELDPKFLQTVTIDERHPIKVFIQEAGECNGMYFTNKTSTGFDVAELHNGSSNAPFVYRVVCKRKYYEDERLATEEEDIKYNTHVLETVWPEVLRKAEEEKARVERTTRSQEERPKDKN